MPKTKRESIRLRGVRQNNLKGVDVDIPVGRFTVVTGLSGTGKSSLVFETLHAEGQRRYVETFSPYTRQFLDHLDRPDVDEVENIRPSIAIHQSNTVKTSRSTVGTITELCDYFKVWFAREATLHDPASGEPIHDDNPQNVWKRLRAARPDTDCVIAFPVRRPGKLEWGRILESLTARGFTRVARAGAIVRLEHLDPGDLADDETLLAIQDRVRLRGDARSRFIEAAQTAFTFGKGEIRILDSAGTEIDRCVQGLISPVTGKAFRPADPPLFSFNSPIGACPECRGFGRVIEIDDRLVVPDENRSIDDGALRPFQGEVYSESLRDLRRAARRHGIRTDVPWRDLTDAEKRFVFDGSPDFDPATGRGWYGVHGFFRYLESKVYRMHVRVFLSKFRSYSRCPACGGARLRPESLNWKWQGHTLPDLYQMSVGKLLERLTHQVSGFSPQPSGTDPALQGILSRLGFLCEVGLGYLTLDRTSRTLSGGETMRVNLTSCLGSSLTGTLFVLDEPSVGLHARDIDRLIGILRRLADQGNTVVVVEHDENVMRAADHLVEIGPEPGRNGGRVTYAGDFEGIRFSDTHTGRFLSGRERIDPPTRRRPCANAPRLSVYGATCHNLEDLDAHIPLGRFVCLGGVSGSGKSTLLDNVIHRNLLAQKGRPVESPAAVGDIECDRPISEVVLVDQSPAGKTPRSNPAVFTGAWDGIRKCFAALDEARAAGLTPGHFSFNSGDGRCDACGGLGYEKVEMQFVSDLYVPCEVCEGKRFKNEILKIRFREQTISDILEMDVAAAIECFGDYPKIVEALRPVVAVGLGYLHLGQPLNTLSGGEAQRLKLVRHLGAIPRAESGDPSQSAEAHNPNHAPRIPNPESRKKRGGSSTDSPPSQGGVPRQGRGGSAGALILIDEPTTGLHRHDIRRLIGVFQQLVEAGHSLIVIEHNLDVLKVADWLIEMGPGAGTEGGRIVAEGTPNAIARRRCESAPYLREALDEGRAAKAKKATSAPARKAAEPAAAYGRDGRNERTPAAEPGALTVRGAREHNLRDISVEFPRNRITVVTGVSGSGKSSLAFDVVFAEGQRRFMESMSAYARQFVEQLPKAEVEALDGIAPTVAIEQRVTKGTRKSTVATITEVAQYLRLLYARIGVQHSPTSGEPVVSQSEAALRNRLRQHIADNRSPHLYLCAQLVRGRKGHHQPIADWARDRGHTLLRADGKLTRVENFRKLDRYREHDIDLVVADLGRKEAPNRRETDEALRTALRLGKGTAFLLRADGQTAAWLSTTRTDPATGEAFPELDPKHFSWNSPRGWCPTCRGYGALYEWMADEESSEAELPDVFEHGEPCPDCGGARLNALSRSVRLPLKSTARRALKNPPPSQGGARRQGRGGSGSVSLPELLHLTPGQLLDTLAQITTTKRTKPILEELMPEIEERLAFMDRVGLDYLQLDRATATLSGGEAQRIRLAAQLGSNLSGVLYVLDEPSIGLHARDNARLIRSLEELRNRGNTLIVVEHDTDTMRHADRIIDLGPGAGIHGGHVVAQGTLAQLRKNKTSLTGRYLRERIQHPLRGEYRPLPAAWSPRRKKDADRWIALRSAALRNLKGFDLAVPKQRLTVVCGPSGAGKSTLVRDLLKPAVESAAERKTDKLTPAKGSGDKRFGSLHHAADVRKVIEVDQSPIGKTPRSTPATYIGAFDIVRDIFAELPEARFRGYGSGTFSFNTKGGRCENCKGAGRVKLEMNFMPDTYVGCEECGGSRYGAELEDIRWNGKNIADVLAMSFEEAAGFFSFHTRLREQLELMVETGLGYLTLGQNSPSLSGGEAQRLKLVSELAKGMPSFKERDTGGGAGNLYILEEPTIGLHLSDCRRLIELLHRLVDKGHTVIVIEHHLEVIQDADYVVEIGPDGGEKGGRLLYQGDVAGLRESPDSITAEFL